MTSPSKSANAPIEEFIPELDRLAADAMADWKVPGVALAVVQDGKVTLAMAYGQRDVEANLPVTTATQFLICSITKSFTATGMALLHNEGRLDWTKPVRDYMPEFRLHDAVATERAPKFRAGRAYWHPDKTYREFEACFLPLSADGETVDIILGGVKSPL